MKKNAFTIVELVVTITILIILLSISFFSYGAYTSQARDTLRIEDLKNIEKAIKLYELKKWDFPNPENWVFWERNLQEVESLDKVPVDPITKEKYKYTLSGDWRKYKLEATLENGEKYVLENKVLASEGDELRINNVILVDNLYGDIIYAWENIKVKILVSWWTWNYQLSATNLPEGLRIDWLNIVWSVETFWDYIFDLIIDDWKNQIIQKVNPFKVLEKPIPKIISYNNSDIYNKINIILDLKTNNDAKNILSSQNLPEWLRIEWKKILWSLENAWQYNFDITLDNWLVQNSIPISLDIKELPISQKCIDSNNSFYLRYKNNYAWISVNENWDINSNWKYWAFVRKGDYNSLEIKEMFKERIKEGNSGYIDIGSDECFVFWIL